MIFWNPIFFQRIYWKSIIVNYENFCTNTNLMRIIPKLCKCCIRIVQRKIKLKLNIIDFKTFFFSKLVKCQVSVFDVNVKPKEVFDGFDVDAKIWKLNYFQISSFLHLSNKTYFDQLTFRIKGYVVRKSKILSRKQKKEIMIMLFFF